MATLNPAILRAMLNGLNSTDQDIIQVSKPVIRAILFELIRLQEAEKLKDNERAQYVQALTMEYASMHMADLLTGLLKTDMNGVGIKDVVAFAVHQLEEMIDEVKVTTTGTA